jgi:hypothetical protein
MPVKGGGKTVELPYQDHRSLQIFFGATGYGQGHGINIYACWGGLTVDSPFPTIVGVVGGNIFYLKHFGAQ